MEGTIKPQESFPIKILFKASKTKTYRSNFLLKLSQFGFEPQITEIVALGKHSFVDERIKRQSKQIKLSPIVKNQSVIDKLSDKKDEKSTNVSIMKSESVKEKSSKDGEIMDRKIQKDEINKNLKLQLTN